jgi:hypothetical protein
VLLPSGGIFTAIKLAIATWGTLVLPGAVILRLIGWPASPAAALPACAAWSMTALAPGFVLMLATGGGVPVIALWLLAVIGAGLVIGRGKRFEIAVDPSRESLVFGGAVLLFAFLVAIGSWNNVGDAVEHIARMRKITELDPPARHLDQLGLLPPGTGLHAGYAFPLWHATGATGVWLSGLEETIMFRYWPSILMPFIAAAIFDAGRQMFRSRAAGIGVCLGYLGVYAFPNGVGYFAQVSYPGYICIFLFWPLVVARTFTYLREGGREPILTAAAASFVVSAVHPSYAPYMIMLIAAFLVARTLVTRDRTELRRLGTMLGAVSVPFLLFLIWLYPIADANASTIDRAKTHFQSLVDASGDLVNMKAGWATRGGAVALAALACVPLASAAARHRAAAFIAGTSAAVLLTLLVPWFFTPFAEVMSISQGRRFLFYLPWAFALMGGALVLSRLRYIGVALALATGIVLNQAWPGDFDYHLSAPGPGWLAWFAAGGALIALAAGAAAKLEFRYKERWAVLIVAALVLPVAVTGIDGMHTFKGTSGTINSRLIAAVRLYVTPEDVLMAMPETAYRLDAQAPIYIAAVAGGHGGDTVLNNSYERRRDVARFFRNATEPEEAQEIVDRWDVQWVLVRKDEPYPQQYLSAFHPVYEDKLFILYPVDPAILPRVDATAAAHSGKLSAPGPTDSRNARTR